LLEKRILRRFKEFVNLHKKFEENIAFKPLTKSIKGPTNFLSLPIGNMDEEYIKKRKSKLNAYLNVCIVFI
jgi:hypothetical protein